MPWMTTWWHKSFPSVFVADGIIEIILQSVVVLVVNCFGLAMIG
jgi:hypothetical protein